MTASAWMLPGGREESGRTLTAALRREPPEEPGLRLMGDPRIAFAVGLPLADSNHSAIRTERRL